MSAKPPGNLIVLGADTTVVCDGEILAKPADAADAKRMLRQLSGGTHQVLTGIAGSHTRGRSHRASNPRDVCD